MRHVMLATSWFHASITEVHRQLQSSISPFSGEYHRDIGDLPPCHILWNNNRHWGRVRGVVKHGVSKHCPVRRIFVHLRVNAGFCWRSTVLSNAISAETEKARINGRVFVPHTRAPPYTGPVAHCCVARKARVDGEFSVREVLIETSHECVWEIQSFCE